MSHKLTPTRPGPEFSHKLTLHQVMKLGLEVWVIRYNNRDVYQYLSERIARTRFERLRMELERGLHASTDPERSQHAAHPVGPEGRHHVSARRSV